MRIAVCEDETVFMEQLRDQLYLQLKCYEDMVVDTFESGELFLETYEKNPYTYEIIFMDIEMKKIDGIMTARRVRERNKDVVLIFLTSHIEFALEGYEVDAFRFLAKPINEEKLTLTLQDIQREMSENKRIIIKDADREIIILHKEIVSIEACNVNLLIHTQNHSYRIRKSLMQLESELNGPMFYKTHRSYLINLGHLIQYTNKEVTMDNGERIPLSRNKLKELKEALIFYVKTCGK